LTDDLRPAQIPFRNTELKIGILCIVNANKGAITTGQICFEFVLTSSALKVRLIIIFPYH
jgi:hypothetical protein